MDLTNSNDDLSILKYRANELTSGMMGHSVPFKNHFPLTAPDPAIDCNKALPALALHEIGA
jgi:hypothetical protein